MSPVRLHHRIDGAAQAPPVLLAPSLGTTLAMWDAQVATLVERYRVVRFDTRGHGGSPVPPGPYSVEQLADDVVALADELGLDRFALVGLSLGGAIGQVLALDHPGRLSALVLGCTGPSFAEPATWRERASRVRAEGTGWLVQPTGERWLTACFRDEHPERTRQVLAMLATVPPEGYAACCDALAEYDVGSRLSEITAPTRVICGSEDPVSPPEVARVLEAEIPNADLVVVDHAAHLANIARPELFADAVTEHLGRHL